MFLSSIQTGFLSSLFTVDIIIMCLYSVNITLQFRKKLCPSYFTQWLYRLLSFLDVTIILFSKIMFVYMLTMTTSYNFMLTSLENKWNQLVMRLFTLMYSSMSFVFLLPCCDHLTAFYMCVCICVYLSVCVRVVCMCLLMSICLSVPL